VSNIINSMRPYIDRKFYLYENEPHCFLAFDLIDEGNLSRIEKIVLDNSLVFSFIESAQLHGGDTKDEENGEDFLNILNAFTEAYLFQRKSKLTHIIHCCMEFIHQSRNSELQFYKTMFLMYGGKNEGWR
jgi:hypothetical protein